MLLVTCIPKQWDQYIDERNIMELKQYLVEPYRVKVVGKNPSKSL